MRSIDAITITITFKSCVECTGTALPVAVPVENLWGGSESK